MTHDPINDPFTGMAAEEENPLPRAPSGKQFISSKPRAASSASTGRRPDFNLAVLNKRTGQKNSKVGAAWVNADGSISVKTDYPFSLDHDPDVIYTLFPT